MFADLITELTKHYRALPLSYSKVSTMLRCPLQYKLRYIDREKGTTAPHQQDMEVGKIVHKVMDLAFTKGPTYQWNVDNIGLENMWGRMPGVSTLSPENKERYDTLKTPTYNSLKRLFDAVVRYGMRPFSELMFCMDTKESMPKKAPNWPRRFFFGYIDLYAEAAKNALVVDFKSHGSSDENKRSANEQLSIYGTFLFLRNPAIETLQSGAAYLADDDLVLDTPVVRGSPDHAVMEEFTVSFIQKFADALNTQEYPACPSKYCKWCTFTEDCPEYVNGGS